eukprot:3810891-Rhodomonas_salina.2
MREYQCEQSAFEMTAEQSRALQPTTLQKARSDDKAAPKSVPAHRAPPDPAGNPDTTHLWGKRATIRAKIRLGRSWGCRLSGGW